MAQKQNQPGTGGRVKPEVVSHEMAAVYRAMTPMQRLEVAWSLWRFAREGMLCTTRQRHPDWHETRVEKDVARRLLDAAS